MNILCCNTKPVPYQKIYNRTSWEVGLKCKICNRIRIPFSDMPITNNEAELDRIREEGILFDSSEAGLALIEFVRTRTKQSRAIYL